MPITTTSADFVAWFRSVAPYINAFRGKTFVIAFGGEVVADGKFVELTHDFNLLAALGIRLVLVHGARPQIEPHLAKNNLGDTYHLGDPRKGARKFNQQVCGCCRNPEKQVPSGHEGK